VTIVIVGNPGNRRVTLFAAAAVAAGLPEPEVVAWRDVAAGCAFRFPAGSLVRVESPGEDPEVDRLLRAAERPAEHGEIVGGRPWYDGFARALARIERAAADSGATLLADPADILVMFDKAVCHRRLHTAGLPVPPALPQEPRDWFELRAWLDEAGWHRVFVKPRHGSSASGVIALQRAPGRVLATTSVERAGPKLFNSLRVRSYRDEREVAAIIDQLAPDGLHVERWFPKASLAGRVIDLRVVMIGGEPSHVVVRSSRHPMTNLHLGGTRGDLRAVQTLAGEHYGAAMRTCSAVAACFPGSRQAGVDLMFGPGWRRHAIAEVNAFGDLLPGLLADGRDTYAAQLAHLAAA
jgi:glutathione synthase/RimK-type ligase-like ATP-grasp enzyme